jgi:ABC-2 type transport system permease protein
MGVMLPMGIAYCLFVKPQALFYVMWVIAIFVTPFVPMTVATVLGAIVSAVSSRFKHTNAVGIILSFVMVLAFLGVSMSTGTLNSSQITAKQLASLGTMISQKMNQAYPLTGVFEKAICQYDMLAFLTLLAISVVWYFLFVKLVSIKYKAINTGLTTHRAESNYKLQSLKEASPFQALYRKELKRFFSSLSPTLPSQAR